jgi:dihydroorotase
MSESGTFVLKGGRVVDPASGRDGKADVLVERGKIARVGARLRPGRGVPAVDVRGRLVLPGLLDMHAHLREPGQEYKETVLTGARAAVSGGFSAVASMPNTDPVNDDPSVTRYILRKAEAAGLARVYPVGCITVGQKGERLAEIGALVDAGCVAVSDDGRPVASSAVMRRAMEYCRHFDIPVIAHSEDLSLAGKGVMHEGEVSARIALTGIPAAAEEVMVARDIALCRLTGSRLHVAHVSTAGSVDLIARAKDEGLPVTAEVTPHHLFLTDEAVASFDTVTKVNPPLRSAADVEALRGALREGVIDAVATDHAPHSSIEKDVDYCEAAFGMIGLETALSLMLRLVEEGVIDLPRAVEAMTKSPANILGVEGGALVPGAPADIAVVGGEEEWVVDATALLSQSRNTPFEGWKLRGRTVALFVDGRNLFESPSFAGP